MNHRPVIAEYIWLGGNSELRSKTKILYDFHTVTTHPQNFPMWNFDGSSTEQAEGLNSELKLKPVAVYQNPFTASRFNGGFLVLCETLDKNDKPLSSNTRAKAAELFETHNSAVQFQY